MRWMLTLAICLAIVPLAPRLLFSQEYVADPGQLPRYGQSPRPAHPWPSATPVRFAEVVAQEHAPVGYAWQEQQTLEERIGALEKKLAEQEKSAEQAEAVDYPTQSWTGRIHADYWSFPGEDAGGNFFERGDPDLDIQDRFLFRRLRLGMLGNVSETVEYKIEFDFAAANDLVIKDAYLGINELPCLHTVLIGNQKRPYGLDHLNSSRYNVFLERPFIVEAINQDARRFGVCSYGVSEDLAYNWRFGSYLSSDIQDTGEYLVADDPGRHHYQAELAGRFANTIWYDEASGGRGYAHWAVSGTLAGADGSAGAESTARFRTRPEARTSSRWLDTGAITGATNYELLGLESVINLGALQIVGEYMHVWVEREANDPDLALHGGYVYVAYFLTGEHMPWDRESGTLGRTRPLENFFLVRTCDGGIGHGLGAWQVAVRLSYADLSDADILGGVGTGVTTGVNWWWNAYTHVQMNYIYGEIEDRYPQRISSATGLPGGAAGPTAGDYHILGLRFAIDF